MRPAENKDASVRGAVRQTIPAPISPLLPPFPLMGLARKTKPGETRSLRGYRRHRVHGGGFALAAGSVLPWLQGREVDGLPLTANRVERGEKGSFPIWGRENKYFCLAGELVGLWKCWCCPRVTREACNQPNHLPGEIWMRGGAQAVAKTHPALDGAHARLRPALPGALQGMNLWGPTKRNQVVLRTGENPLQGQNNQGALYFHPPSMGNRQEDA